jgi:hypothetical protein
MLRAIPLVALLALTACGGDPASDGETAPSTTAPAPVIGADMELPVEDPFCTFTAEGGAPEGGYVFVTSVGESVYHGYARLDGETTRLTEVEAGFGAGIETRRYVTDDESVELEVILLEAGESEEAVSYTGSVRSIFPVEGDAVKFEGRCAYAGDAHE